MSSGARSELTTRTGFRGDVQGLRAIAVIVVIAGHAGVSFLPGGFVGVDVFFVISGFLISQVLLDEVASSGRISLRDFYARRARRILPAATLVLSVTVVASLVWLSAVDALRVVSDALWASVFAANVRFADVGADYFAAEQAPSPLQHYWSLAVEEQFYLVWPLLLLGLLWVARRRVAPQPVHGAALSPTRGTIVIGLVVVAACSLTYATVATAADPVSTYFSTPARAWELAVGAALAGVARPLAGRLTLRARGLLATSGLLAVTVACARYDAGTSFPGPAALLPVLGTAAVLLAGSGGHPVESRATRALGVGPLRVVGDWSYSLYLWHWPLLVVPASALQRPLTALETTAAVAATFVLAGAT
ncbi:acyltransferase, partial [Nocardioides sp.]|uniref:acyltransferase family protein n=1 Tax=Nocardioides sp. TaxID=35761 RepID=UPI002B26B38B